MKNITLLLIIGLLGASLTGCAVYDDGYYYDQGPGVDIGFFGFGGGGGGWGGGGGHGWHGGHGGGGHGGGGHHH